AYLYTCHFRLRLTDDRSVRFDRLCFLPLRPSPRSTLFPYTTLFRSTPLPTVNTTGYIDHAAFLGTINPDTNKIPKHLFQGYLNIYNNYFKAPWMPDRTEANPNELNQDDARYGF